MSKINENFDIMRRAFLIIDWYNAALVTLAEGKSVETVDVVHIIDRVMISAHEAQGDRRFFHCDNSVMLLQILGGLRVRQLRRIGGIIGLTLLFGGLVTLAVEAFGWWRNDVWEVISFGSAWVNVNANSLVGLGTFVENAISPRLWSEIMVPLLTLPLWLLLGLPGIVLIIMTRHKRRFGTPFI